MLFAILMVFIIFMDTITARYAIILEEASNCSVNSKIILNYTYSNMTNIGHGYVEVLEKIEANSNTLMAVDIKYITTENLLIKNPKFNVTKTDVCIFLNMDMMYLPYLRQFVFIERFCPIHKGSIPIHKSTILINYRPITPLGCLRAKLKMEKNGMQFACLYFKIQVLPSLESKRSKCYD